VRHAANLDGELAELVLSFSAAIADDPRLSENTRLGYVSRVQGFLKWLTADSGPGGAVGLPRDRATLEHAASGYRQWMLTTGRWAPRTVNAHLTAVSAFCAWLGFRLAADHLKTTPRPRSLDVEERRRLDDWAAANSSMSLRDRAILLTFRYTGVLLDELCSLNTDDIAVIAGNAKIKVTPAGGKPRKIPVAPPLRSTLLDYLARRLGTPAAKQRPLFLSRLGRRISPDAAAQVVAAAAVGAELTKCTPHTLRHTFETQLRRNGVDPIAVEVLLGRNLGVFRHHFIAPSADELGAEIEAAFPLQ
jgi:site-specific recombinase XerD